MKAGIKSFDFKFGISLCLLLAWVTLCFTPAQKLDLLKVSPSGFLHGTFLTVPGSSEADSFEPFALFEANLSKLSFRKSSPSGKFLPFLGGFLQAFAGDTSLTVLKVSPVLDFFLFSPPNKASP